MKHIIYTSIIIIICWISAYSQTEFKKHVASVQNQSIKDTTFRFVKYTANDSIESFIRYYGKTKSKCNVFYIRETYPAALIRHGQIFLYIIDSLGHKYRYSDIDEPDKLSDGVIEFKHTDKNGNPYVYKTDLNSIIPKFLCVDHQDCYDHQIDK